MAPPLKSSLSRNDLQHMAESFLQFAPDASVALRTFTLAYEVLINLLGPDWTKEHVHLPSRENGQTHLERREEHRVLRLAEALFNIQSLPGFAFRVEEVRRGSVESTLAELDVARLVVRGGVPFEFVVPSGVLGQDFDALLKLPSCDLPAEVKSKVSGTVPTFGTIYSSLEAARKQLPRTRPGAVFVRLPETWIASELLTLNVRAAVAKVFRQSKRIALVVFHWEEWAEFAHDFAVCQIKFSEHLHPQSDLFPVLHRELTEPMAAQTQPLPWVEFRDIVQGESRTD